MDDIQLVHLHQIAPQALIDLMNHPRVRQYLPLLKGDFTEQDCQAFLKAKQKLWDEDGYGPWAIVINGHFAGWGGLQKEGGDADFALILHPDYWGWGRRVFHHLVDQAFIELKLTSITILLPPYRPNAKALQRLGFVKEGELVVGGETFLRFRLQRPDG